MNTFISSKLINMASLRRVVTPAQFLRIMRSDQPAIKKTKFIPPKLGTRSFGSFLIEYYYVPGENEQSAESRTI